MLLWCQFLWKLEQGVRSSGPQYCQVTKRTDNVLCRMPRLMGFQTLVTSCTFNHRGRVHHNVTIFTWRHPCYEPATGNEGARLPSHLYQTSGVLQDIWDNSGALELTRLPQLCPRTKHINVCYHHFCKHVRKGRIKIFPIDTKDQIADTLMKALAQNDLQGHCCYMCGKKPPLATEVRECYIFRVLWYIFRILTYQSHVTA